MRRRSAAATARSFARVICHSEWGRRALVERCGVRPGRVRVIPHGAFRYLRDEPEVSGARRGIGPAGRAAGHPAAVQGRGRPRPGLAGGARSRPGRVARHRRAGDDGRRRPREPRPGGRDREPLPARRRAGRAPAPGGRSSCSLTDGSTARAFSSPRWRSGAPSCSRTSGASGSSTTSTASASSSRRETRRPSPRRSRECSRTRPGAQRSRRRASARRRGRSRGRPSQAGHEAVYRELVRVTPPPFFIVGCDRSGTTMLRLILDGSPDVAIPTESMILVDFAGQRRRRRSPPTRSSTGSPAPSGAIRRCASGAFPARLPRGTGESARPPTGRRSRRRSWPMRSCTGSRAGPTRPRTTSASSTR